MIRKRFLFGLVFSDVVAVISVAMLFIFSFTLDDDGIKFLFMTIFTIVAVLFFSLGAFFFSKVMVVRFNNKLLTKENKYVLGTETDFYNMDIFTNRCIQQRGKKAFAKKEQYLIAFTASNRHLMQNNQRNEAIITLNGQVALALRGVFDKEQTMMGSRNHIFCFDRGVFFLYCFGDNENQIKKIIEELKNMIYNIACDDQLKVFIEPLFGYRKVMPGSLLSQDIDDAMIARNVAESKFETVIPYVDSFRKTASTDDTKEILEALENDEFVVYYQPKYSLRLKQFTSAEALVRWNSKKHGLLPPSKFINIAEIAGLIHEIDAFVFRRVCEDLNEAKRRGRRILPVSVNFSLYEFFSSKFLDEILNILDENKVDPHLIQIEITETTSQANQFLSISIIKKLKERGIKILMDDFGIGFSNIGNLRKIPFDVVKIDKSFIDTIHTDPKSAEVVKFLVRLCRINEMEVVAEGVDNQKQVDLLKKFNCDEIQGYYYSKPLPKNEYQKFLLNNPFETRDKEGNLK